MNPLSNLRDGAVLATVPTRFWWVPPLVTLLAVLLAFWMSYASLRQQRRAFDDNRELRVADDVREVLADALRDMHQVCRALEDAEGVIALNNERARVSRSLGSIEISGGQVDRLNHEMTLIHHEMRSRKRAADDAFAGVQLQAERLGLLLGRRHPLFVDHMFGIIVYLGAVPQLEIWKLPEFDKRGRASASAARELRELYERVVDLIDDLSAAGHAYVEEHQKAGRRPKRVDNAKDASR